MQLVADLLLLLGALGATVYCVILSRRLRRFSDLENGVGGAIAVLSAQVDDMTRSLESARRIAQGSAVTLDGVTERAEAASQRLELLIASLHDLPDVSGGRAPEPAPSTLAASSSASDAVASGAARATPAPELSVPGTPTDEPVAQLFSSVRRLRSGGE